VVYFFPSAERDRGAGSGLVVIAVTIYRFDRVTSCGRSGNGVQ
jgi:hypothetical protein